MADDKAIAKADEQAQNELGQAKTALEIAKDVATTPEQATERDKLIEQINKLQKQLDETTGERDTFKRERDEANASLREMSTANKAKGDDDFDKIFGGKEE